ncbi:MAG: hypothetical protein ACR2OC_05495 [Solirubrobacterales bacterium]
MNESLDPYQSDEEPEEGEELSDPLDPPGEALDAEAEQISPQKSASRIEEIMLGDQRSARHFVDEARQQSSLLVEETDRQTREQRAEIVERSRVQVDDLLGDYGDAAIAEEDEDSTEPERKARRLGRR